MTDWMLKWGEGKMKSKREVEALQIGLQSGGKAFGSPKGRRGEARWE